MIIQHNIMAMNAYRNYKANTSALSSNLEKLSSGYKINRAGDDAAGLAISEKMRAQITGLEAAQKNVKDGVSLVKTAEGAMQEIQDMLNRMDYLATQSANGTYDNEVDRANLMKEVTALKDEINRIADSANFNGIKLLDGSQAAADTDAMAVTSTISAGADANIQYAPKDVTSHFATTTDATTDANAWHAGSGNGAQTTVAFTIDLKGTTGAASAGAASGGEVTFKIAGESITVSGPTADNDDMDGAAFAGLLNGKTVSIQGVSFTATASGSEVKFELANGETYTAAEADALNSHWNDEIEVTAGNSASITSGPTDRHSVYDYTAAQSADSAARAGIDFDLNGLVADGNKLTIDGTTFVFKTSADSTVSADSGNNEVEIDVSDFAAGSAQLAEALRQMTDQQTTAGGNVTLSARNGKLHLDQTATNDAVYDEPEDMHPLVSFQEASNSTPTKGSVSLDLNGFQKGSRIKVGDETYTFIDKTDDDGNVSNEAVDAIKAEIAKTVDTTKYDVTAKDGVITVTAKEHGTDDTESALTAIKTSVDGVMSTLKTANASVGGLTLQIGDTSDDFNQLKVNVGDMHVYAMGTQDDDGKLVTSIEDIDISTQEGAQQAIDVIKNAINYVSGVRGDLGAIQNRLEHTANNLSVMAENITDAESTIRDTDVAEEMMSYVKNNILVQSAQAMLAQANQVPQGVLQLLG